MDFLEHNKTIILSLVASIVFAFCVAMYIESVSDTWGFVFIAPMFALVASVTAYTTHFLLGIFSRIIIYFIFGGILDFGKVNRISVFFGTCSAFAATFSGIAIMFTGELFEGQLFLLPVPFIVVSIIAHIVTMKKSATF